MLLLWGSALLVFFPLLIVFGPLLGCCSLRIGLGLGSRFLSLVLVVVAVLLKLGIHISVPGGGGRLAGLQGFLRGQSSTAPTVVQIVDIPGGGLQGSRPGQGSPASSSFHSPAGSDDDEDEPGAGVIRTFPRPKKKCEVGFVLGSALLPESSPSTPTAQLKVK